MKIRNFSSSILLSLVCANTISAHTNETVKPLEEYTANDTTDMINDSVLNIRNVLTVKGWCFAFSPQTDIFAFSKIEVPNGPKLELQTLKTLGVIGNAGYGWSLNSKDSVTGAFEFGVQSSSKFNMKDGAASDSKKTEGSVESDLKVYTAGIKGSYFRNITDRWVFNAGLAPVLKFKNQELLGAFAHVNVGGGFKINQIKSIVSFGIRASNPVFSIGYDATKAKSELETEWNQADKTKTVVLKNPSLDRVGRLAFYAQIDVLPFGYSSIEE